jgi:hypothetical protein
MGYMKNKIYAVFLVFSILTSCSQSSKLGKRGTSGLSDHAQRTVHCDSLRTFNSEYISKINANVYLGEEQYNVRVSLYYVPDSLFYMSAVNSGFEIVRIGVLPDSIVIINRLDKAVYIKNIDNLATPSPILFKDLEYLLNRNLVCDEVEKKQIGDTVVLVNRSVKDIKREIYYMADDLKPLKFEFFQKKTGEYIVGELTSDDIFVIYSNYIVKNLKIEGWGGVIEYNRVLNFDLSVNRDKYDIYYF